MGKEKKPEPGTTEWLKAEFSRMRKEGMSCVEIAGDTGYSASYVCDLVNNGKGSWFHAKSEEDCIYPGLRAYINEHEVTSRHLAEVFGYKWNTVSCQKIGRLLRGETEFKMSQIRALMRVAGGAENSIDSASCSYGVTTKLQGERKDVEIVKNDLISRSALVAALEDEIAVDKGKMFCLIEAAPAVDAEEVVRCGECKKRKTIKCALSYLVFEDFDVDARFIDVPDDFYCSRGERK